MYVTVDKLIRYRLCKPYHQKINNVIIHDIFLVYLYIFTYLLEYRILCAYTYLWIYTMRFNYMHRPSDV